MPHFEMNFHVESIFAWKQERTFDDDDDDDDDGRVEREREITYPKWTSGTSSQELQNNY